MQVRLQTDQSVAPNVLVRGKVGGFHTSDPNLTFIRKACAATVQYSMPRHGFLLRRDLRHTRRPWLALATIISCRIGMPPRSAYRQIVAVAITTDGVYRGHATRRGSVGLAKTCATEPVQYVCMYVQNASNLRSVTGLRYCVWLEDSYCELAVGQNYCTWQ
jgi:hypothetical protein